jgi:heme oxygenase
MPSSALHMALKESTADCHRHVDDAYSGFDLSTKDGYAQFLWAHRIAAANYQQWFDYFAIRFFRESAPDYSDMLFSDLGDLKLSMPQLPLHHQPWNSRVLSTAFLLGLGYTICGSRLGMAAINKEWRESEFGLLYAHNARFMSDRKGLLLWRKLMEWCATATPTPSEEQEACEASIETFGLFLSAANIASGTPCNTPDMEKPDAA